MIRGKQNHNFNSTHKVRSLIPLNLGDDVWLPKEETTAKDQSSARSRSCNVTTSNGNMIRRNRKHLITLPTQNDSNENQRTSSGRMVKPLQDLVMNSTRKGDIVVTLVVVTLVLY